MTEEERLQELWGAAEDAHRHGSLARRMPIRISIEDTVERIVTLAAADVKDVGAMGFKLMEEVGELAETINYKLGNLPHKKMKESPFGEAADAIQCVIALLSKAYPEQTPRQILTELAHQLNIKTDKWESVLVRK